MIDLTNKAFVKSESSLFIITSPLQVLCMVEAINEFSISQYKIIVVCHHNEIRNHQTFSMLAQFHLDYSVMHTKTGFSSIFELFGTIIKSCHPKFNRIFVGDYYSIEQFVNVLKYSSRNTCCVVMDDGIATYAALNNITFYKTIGWKIKNYILSILSKYRKLELRRNFFTVFYDVYTSNYVYPNYFRYINSMISNKSSDSSDVYIIGTNTELYCDYAGVSINAFINFLQTLFAKVRNDYPYDTLYYIPHGRCNNQQVIDLCQKCSVVYKRLEEAVELYFVNYSIFPKMVCGFLSSALINLRRLYPNLRLISYYYANKSNVSFEKNYKTHLYFLENGIESSFVNSDL